jgi:hypothetical protein
LTFFFNFLIVKYPALLVAVPEDVPAQIILAPGKAIVSVSPGPPGISTLPSTVPCAKATAGMISANIVKTYGFIEID